MMMTTVVALIAFANRDYNDCVVVSFVLFLLLLPQWREEMIMTK